LIISALYYNLIIAETSIPWQITCFPGKAKEDQIPAELLFIPNTEPGAANRKTQFPEKLSKDTAILTAASLNKLIEK
jgi:hypothetical protein